MGGRAELTSDMIVTGEEVCHGVTLSHQSLDDPHPRNEKNGERPQREETARLRVFFELPHQMVCHWSHGNDRILQ